jgi:hypothetical protein
VITFNLLAYDNKYFGKLIGNWIIQVNSQKGQDVNLEMGLTRTIQLDLSCGKEIMMSKLYSSHPHVATFPPPFDGQFEVLPTKKSVYVNLTSFQKGKIDILVNCIDNRTKALVQRWMFKLNTVGRTPTEVQSEELRVGDTRTFKLPYKNASMEYCEFNVNSSQPDVLSVIFFFLRIQAIESRIGLQGGDHGMIRFKIMPQRSVARYMVYIFVNDVEGKISDCYVINVNVVS